MKKHFYDMLPRLVARKKEERRNSERIQLGVEALPSDSKAEIINQKSTGNAQSERLLF